MPTCEACYGQPTYCPQCEPEAFECRCSVEGSRSELVGRFKALVAGIPEILLRAPENEIRGALVNRLMRHFGVDVWVGGVVEFHGDWPAEAGPSSTIEYCSDCTAPKLVGPLADIAAERERQLVDEHFDAAHDDAWTDGQLAWAAACYAAPDRVTEFLLPGGVRQIAWPWDEDWDKRLQYGREWQLVIAGALIVAELERLARTREGSQGDDEKWRDQSKLRWPFGPLRPATDTDLTRKWIGSEERFRCYLCGHRFEVGDLWRAVYTNGGMGQPDWIPGGNPFVCESCDGPKVFEKWAEAYKMAEEKFWWYRPPEDTWAEHYPID